MRFTSRAFLIIVLSLALFPSRSFAQTPGSLIKLSCPAGSASDHPCRAVYFYGSDGKRHAFPNEKTYFTWYTDFSGVRTVSASFMASLPLGGNVTYRPGVRMVKFTTDPKTYAVSLGGILRWVGSEALATQLYGTAWNTKIDDISDAFFSDYRFGAEVSSASDFNQTELLNVARTIDDNLPSTRRSLSVTTTTGTFSIELIKLQRGRFRMITDVAANDDCSNNCAVKNLRDYALGSGAQIGMHGSYFCPPDYPECADKINTFLSPFYDTDTRTMVNQGSMNVHKGPMFAYLPDGSYRYFHRARDVSGTAVDAAASNYPSLVENGTVIVESEERLEGDMRTAKSVRGGIGIDAYFVYLVVARSATVPDLANIMQSLGTTDAMNLDGGGSAALWYEGAYAFGPGRDLPNAILFKAL